MRRAPELTPFPVAGSRSSTASWWSRLSPLARDIIVILIVKAIVLTLLWYAFFRAPAAPRMKMDPVRVEQRFLAPLPETPHVIR
ncbi:MAG: cytochrome oxidase putative small subunit CydP [Betaproteobacteria bacterium]